MTCDPYWNQTVLACHFDGVDSSTSFVDEKGHTLTANGNAQLTTTSPKFGTACATFDGAGDYIVVPDSPDFEFGSGHLTIEFWIKTTQTLGYACPLGRDNGAFPAGAWAILLNGNGSGSIQMWNASYSTGNVFLQSAAISLNDGSWHHIAITRNGSAWNVWKDGSSVASNTWVGAIADVALDLNIGRDPGYSRNFNGYIDDLRITKAARYTASFTPPAASFLHNQCVISGTVKDAAGNFAAKMVRAFRRDTAALVGSAVSNATTGAYSISADHQDECFVVAHDDSNNPPTGGTENAVILDRVLPV